MIKKMEIGDKLLCKRDADEDYFNDLKKELSYKELSYREWDFPKQNKEYVIDGVTYFGQFTFITIKNIPRVFYLYSSNKITEKWNNRYSLLDWFYTKKEAVKICRKLKLERFNTKI